MEWMQPEQGLLFSAYEGTTISDEIIEISGSSNYTIAKISGNLPEGIDIIKNDDNYYFSGSLGYVPETTMFYFTLEARDLDTNEFIQRWFSIEVTTKNTLWDDNNNVLENAIERTYYSKQFELIDPEGNEVWKKITGELPIGLELSESGLLYGVPEEDRDRKYNFTLGVYRNDELIVSSPVLSLKVDNLSTLAKPIWITESGVLEYVFYNEYKEISFKALDYNGRQVYYELGSKQNFPLGITFTDDTVLTGKLEGTCETNIANNWEFSVIPYTILDGTRIYGDEITFILVSNYVDRDNTIEWITETLDEAKIGYRYSAKIEAESSNPIRYSIIYGNLPNGLSMDKNGNIYGNINFQDIKEYKFIVKAETDITFSQKEFSINVVKGLSYDSLDVYLNINLENHPEYLELLNNFNMASAYNIKNINYRVPSTPRIDIGTIKTWDNVLIKHLFERFNTPIEINWRTTKKKSFENYDFFYKDFQEVNKISELWDLKKHTDNETVYTRDDGTTEIRGYIRTPVDESDVKIIYKTLEGVEVDPQYVRQETTEEKTNYYYFDPETKEEYLIADPEYLPQRDTYDYAEFGKLFTYINDRKIYVIPAYKGEFYEIESRRMLSKSETIYVKTITLETGEKVLIRYILKDGEEIEVDYIRENGYAKYNPNTYNSEHYYLKRSEYGDIEKEENKNHYYYFSSPIKTFRTTSINSIKEILSLPVNVSQYDGKLWYKIGNQEFVYKKNGDIQDFDFQKYTISYDEKNNRYIGNFEGNVVYLYVYDKIDDNTYRQIFTEIDGEMKPLIQKSSILSGDIDYQGFVVYKEGETIPFTNALFKCDWEDDLYLTCEYDEETGIYEWFKIKEVENPYVFYHEENPVWQFDKDIVLPNITEEHIKDGVVKFLDLDEEKDLLPEYMEGTYNPTLPLFFAIPNSHNAVLQKINSSEKNDAEYWYGRKFIFYEVHFSPKFKKNIDNFTIDFYNHVNDNSPEFQLI